MYRAVTNNIIVEVVPRYEGLQADSNRANYVFSYTVTVINNGDRAIQLLRRYWVIKSATGTTREVEGEGVIGLQPILKPGKEFEYQSWAPINSEIGEMWGTFYMIYTDTEEAFEVEVPRFQFITDALQN